MSDYAAECQTANRIAARLRGLPVPQPQRKVARPTRARTDRRLASSGPRVRANVTGIAGKGAYLTHAKEALLLDLLAFCREFFLANDQLPPKESVASRLRVRQRKAQDYMHDLAAAGHIERNAVGKWRFSRTAAAPGASGVRAEP